MKTEHTATHALYTSSALYSRNTRLLAGLAFSVATLGVTSAAYALPQDGTVVSGNITITQSSSNHLDINQTTDKGIINWRNFDILTGESVNVQQLGASSIELERVTGSSSPTQILGSLTSNGRIAIVNGAGVFFGAGSTVNVAGLIVSTADITNQNFNAGRLNFNIAGRPDASIINKGSITAAEGGLVALVAPGVVNDGVITAKLGTVALGSGNGFTVDLYGDGLYSFSVDAPATQAGKDENGKSLTAGITNTGKILAQGGTVYMTARAAEAVVDQAINTTGLVDVSAAHKVGGTIVLDGGDGNVMVAGKLDASGKGAGQSGGKIQIASNGGKIQLVSAILDARGATGGGTVNVGGELHGGGTLPHAGSVYVDESSLIDTSALDTGNGGTVSVWSDGNTEFDGTALAKGGSNGGNGGIIETSGDILGVDDKAIVDASAANGQRGTWLLDPNNIIISNDPSTNVTGTNNITSTNDSAIVNAGVISTALNSTDVTITTGSGGTNSQAGNIEVASSIQKTAGADTSLTLQADNDIVMDAGTQISSSSGKLNVTFDSDHDGNHSGSITLTNANIRSNGGNVTLGGGANPTTGYAYGNADHTSVYGGEDGILLSDSVIRADGGNIIVNGHGGDNTQNAGVQLHGLSRFKTTSGNITVNGVGGTATGAGAYGVLLSSGGNIATVTGNINVTGTGGVAAGGYGNGIELYNGSFIDVNGTGTITLTGTAGTPSSALDVGIYSELGDNTIGSRAALGAVDTGAVTLNVDSAHLRSMNVSTGSNLTVNTGNITLSDGSTLSAGAVSGTLAVNNTGVFTGEAGTLNGNTVSVNQHVGGSIQNTIDAVGTVGSGGATVNVGAGNYEEQLTIAKNLTLHGAGQGVTTIESPDTLTGGFATTQGTVKSVITAQNASNVNINNLTVDGLSKGNANFLFAGIGYNNAGGTVDQVTVKNTQSNPFSGAQGGDGIYGYAASGTNRTLTVSHSNVGSFQKNGVVFSGANLTGNAIANIITGAGANSLIGQNGIEFINGAKGSATGNTISSIGYTPVTGTASDILLFGAGDGVNVSGNTITGTGTENGIYDYQSNGATINGNTITNAAYGITVDSSNNVTVGTAGNGNTVTGGIVGAEIFDSSNVSLADNSFSGMSGAGSIGLLLAGADSNITATGDKYGDADNLIVNQTTGLTLDAHNETFYKGPGLTNAYTTGSADQLALSDRIQDVLDNSLFGRVITVLGKLFVTSGHSIQDAVNVASNNDDIVVGAGTYNGNVTISNKPLTLESAAGDTVIVNATADNAAVIAVSGAGDNIESLTISGNGHTGVTGVSITSADNSAVKNNTISGVATGITLNSSDGVTVSGNHVTSSGDGIDVTNSDLTVSGNTFTGAGTGTGISLSGVSGAGNSVNTNTIDNYTTGISLDNSTANVTGNILGATTANATGISLISGSSGNTISGNTIDRGITAISVNGSNNETISGNQIGITHVVGTGITLTGSTGDSVTGSTIDTIGDGIDVSSASSATILGNTITETGINGNTGINVTGGSTAAIGDGTAPNANTISNFNKGVSFNSSTGSVKQNTLTSNGTGVGITSSNNVTADHNTISGGQFGVVVETSGNDAVTQNTINGATSEGVFVDQSNTVNVAGNTIGSLGGSANGISVNQTTGATVTGNTISNTGFSTVGITANASDNVQVKNNTLTGINGDGIDVSNGTGATITGNSVTNGAGTATGIAVNHVTSAIVGQSGASNANTVTGFTTGIKLSNGSDGSTISSNTVDGGTTSISVDHSNHVSLLNNILTHVGAHGIVVSNSDLTVSGNSMTAAVAGTGTGIELDNITGLGNSVDTNTVTDFNTGILLDNSHSDVTGNILNNDTHAIVLKNGSTGTVSDNTINGGLGTIELDGALSVTVSGNTFTGITGDGIDVNGGNSITVVGNTIDAAAGNTGTGIKFDGTTGVNNIGDGSTLGQNSISGFKYGISLKNLTRSVATVFVNILTGITGDGITVDHSDTVKTLGNTVTADAGNTTGTGIKYTNVTGNNAIGDGSNLGSNTVNGFGTGISIDNTQGNVLGTINTNTLSGNITGISVTSVGGHGSDNAIIINNTITGDTTGITVTDVNSVTATKNTMTGITGDGIDVAGGDSATVTANTLTGTGHSTGIKLANVTGTNTVGTGNTTGINTVNSFDTGIALDNTTGSVLKNTLNNNTTGISVANHSDDSTVDHNTITGGNTGINVDTSNGIDITNNSVTGATNGINVHISDLTVTGNTLTGTGTGKGIALSAVTGKGNTVSTNTVNNYATGIELDSSRANVKTNTLSNDATGISLINNSKNNTVSGNSIAGASIAGINVDDSDGNKLGNNTITTASSGDGIDVSSSANTTITHNGITAGTTGTGTGIKLTSATGNNKIGDGNSNKANTITGFSTGILLSGSTGTIDTNTLNNNLAGIMLFNHSDGVLAQNNTINGSFIGISVDSSDTVQLLTNTLTSVSGDGIDVDNSADTSILGNHITSTPANNFSGVQLIGDTGTTVGNTTGGANTITGFGDGVNAQGSSNVNISGNSITGAANVGVFVDPSSNITISTNIISNVGTGISVDSLSGTNSIDTNTINTTAADGIDASNSTGLTIAGNLVGTLGGAHNIQGDGIAANNTTGVVIKSNQVSNTKSNATDIGSGIHVTNTDGAIVGGPNVADGNTVTNIDWDGIKFTGGSNDTAQNNIVNNIARVGIYAGNLSTGSIKDNTVTNTHLAGYGAISTDNGSNLTISGNKVSDSAGLGILVNTATGTNLVDNNTINNVAEDGIGGNTDTNLTISNNKIGQITGNINGHGIHVGGLTGASFITANTIDHTGSSGIRATGDFNLTINLNNIGTNAVNSINGDGIKVDGDDDVSIISNQIGMTTGITGSVTGDGILATGLLDAGNNGNHINGNRIDLVGNDGIHVDTGTDTSTNLGIDSNLIGQYVGVHNNGIEVSGLTFDASGKSSITGNYIDNTQIGAGILASGDTSLTISGNQIGNSIAGYSATGGSHNIATTGINVSGDNNVTIGGTTVADANTVQNTTNDGITVTGLTNGAGNNLIGYNKVDHTGANGISAYSSVALSIDSNKVGQNGGSIGNYGIVVDHLSAGSSITSNLVDYTANDGIHATNDTGLTIASNKVGMLASGSIGHYGIYASADDHVTIGGTALTDGNTVNNTAAAGIYVTGLLHATGSNLVGYNTVDHTGADGIDAFSSAALTIDHNMVGLATPKPNSIAGDGIHAENDAGIHITNNHVDPLQNGIYVTASNNAYIFNNTVTNAALNGIYIQNSSGVTAQLNTVDHSGLDGIYATALTGGSLIDHNTVDGSGTNGIEVNTADDIAITNNTIGQAGLGSITNDGIKVNNLTDGSTITGNTIDNTGADGINATHDTGLAIVVNNIGTVTGHIKGNGITVTGDDDVNANSNHIGTAGANSVKGDGISVSGLLDSGVLSNTIINNTIDGIAKNGIVATNAPYLGIGDNMIGQTYGIGRNGIKVDHLSADIHSNSSITGNTIDNTGKDGITADHDSNLAINGNFIGTHAGNIGGNGITVAHDADSDINLNTIRHTAGSGIVVSHLTGNANYILFDTIDNTGVDGVDASSSVNLDIGRNWIGNNGGTGIGGGGITGYGINANTLTFNGSGHSSIYLNLIDNTGKDAIHASGDTGLYIVTNTIGLHGGNIGGNGINVDTSVGTDDNLSVQRNIVQSTALDGITVNGLTGTNLIDTNHVDYVTGNGISASGDTGLTIDLNHVGELHAHSITGYGIYVSADDDVTIGGTTSLLLNANTVNNTGSAGIYVTGLTNNAGHGNLVGYNNVDFTGADGIDAYNSADLTIDHNQVGTVSGAAGIGGDGIHADHDAGVQITNNTVDPLVNGIYVTASDNAFIDTNTITHAGNDGIEVQGGGSVTVSNNTISNVGTGINVNSLTGTNSIYNNTINTTAHDGIDAADSTGLTIDSNKVGLLGGAHNIQGDGIAVTNTTGVVIKRNHVSNTLSTAFDHGSGIHVTNTDGAIVGGPNAADGNTVTKINWDGIKFTGGSNATVENNVVDNTTRVGIYAGGLSTGSIENNTVTHSHLTGYGAISTDNGSNLTITGNTVNNTDGAGIRINTATGTNLVSSNHVDSTGQDGIDGISSSNLTISNNNIGTGFHSSIGGDGIALYDVVTALITGNHIGGFFSNIHDTGIEVSSGVTSSSNITITGNTVANASTGISVSGLTGTNRIDSNHINIIDNDGIDASGDQNLTINNNQVFGFDGNGINVNGDNNLTITDNQIGFGSGSAISVANLTGTNLIDGNTIDVIDGDAIDSSDDHNLTISNNTIATFFGIAGTGISADGDQNLAINHNTIGSVTSFLGLGGDGIDVSDSSNVTILGNSMVAGNSGMMGISLSNVTTATVGDNGSTVPTGDSNIVSGFDTGIAVTNDSSGITVSNNTLDPGTVGIDIENSDGTVVSNNSIDGFDTGINVSDSNGVQFASNVITGSGTGVYIGGSDDVTFNGDSISDSSQYGIHLKDAQNTIIRNVSLDSNQTGIFGENGSSGTLLYSTTFTNNNALNNITGIMLDGFGTSLQFGDGGSSMSLTNGANPLVTNYNYFVLTNNAMNGQVLDAHNQHFDVGSGGTLVRGQDFTGTSFTTGELGLAEAHTADFLDDNTLGFVFYKAFGPSEELLNQLLQRQNGLNGPLFSFAGQTIASGGIANVQYNFNIQNVNLSLLNAGGGGGVNLGNLSPAAGGNGVDYSSLSPSAGGNQYANLSPSAGGGEADGCANGFLGNGLGTAGSCGAQ